MAITFTTTDLLARIRAMCQLRTDNQKVSSNEILALCDEEIQTNLFPALMSVRDDYAAAVTYQTFTDTITGYRLPFGVASETVTAVELGIISGTTLSSQYQLRRVTIGELSAWTGVEGDRPQVYALMGDTIEVRPTPGPTTSSVAIMVIHYELRPARLIDIASCRVINSAAYPGGTTIDVTLGSTIVGTGLASDSPVNLVPGVPPLGPFATRCTIQSIVADPVISVNIGFSSAAATARLTTDIVAGSYLTPHGSTCVFPMPEAWWPVLIYAGASAVCASIGDDTPALKFATIAEQKKAAVLAMQQNRVRKQPLPAFNKNSPLRSGRTVLRGSNTFP
jgi:hypothetical protein